MTTQLEGVLRALEGRLESLKREGVRRVPVATSVYQEFREALRGYAVFKRGGAVASGASAGGGEMPTESVGKGVEGGQGAERLIPLPKPFELPQGSKQERWDGLRERVLGCEECHRHVKQGKRVVFGVGNLDADIFFCGEAPGADEEIAGEPFVGVAGQLLDKMIKAMGLSRQETYIGNIMNWRPEHDRPYGNRPPNAEEIEFCLPYLKGQLEIVKPKVIVALGLTAAKGLWGDNGQTLGGMRGRWETLDGVPLRVTYHPSYLLRNGTLQAKRKVWEDLLAVMRHLDLSVSAEQEGYFT